MTLIQDARHETDNAEMLEATQAAQAALRILPDTPDAIAMYLFDLGCMGSVGDGKPCALAKYLQASTGWDCEVRRESVTFSTSSWDFTLKLSSVVTHFGWNYDAGDYPYLVGFPRATYVTVITPDELPGLASLEA
jgi:hypothetical protein